MNTLIFTAVGLALAVSLSSTVSHADDGDLAASGATQWRFFDGRALPDYYNRPPSLTWMPRSMYHARYGYSDRASLAVGGGPESAAVFENRARRALDGIESAARDRVNAGTLDPQSLAALREQRDAIERALDAASADGTVTIEEHARIEQRIAAMRSFAEPGDARATATE